MLQEEDLYANKNYNYYDDGQCLLPKPVAPTHFVDLFIAIGTCNKLFGDSVMKPYTNTG